jgi:hypothetical protein
MEISIDGRTYHLIIVKSEEPWTAGFVEDIIVIRDQGDPDKNQLLAEQIVQKFITE